MPLAARAVTLLVLPFVLACGGGGDSSTSPPATVPVHSVTLDVTSIALQVGGTRSLEATLRDASGGVIQGRAIAWVSSDPTVATVSASGSVTAVGAGASAVSASSGDRGARHRERSAGIPREARR